MLAIPGLTLIDLLIPSREVVCGVGLIALVFIARQNVHISVHIRRTSALLGIVTASLLPLLTQPDAAVERGIRIGALIASLLVTINLLSRAAARVPLVRDLLGSLHGVAPQMRYGVLSVTSQFFGGLLGLAGIAMMLESAARQQNMNNRERLSAFSAVSRGYAALSLWSPMYSNMSIVLAMYEGTHWAAVLPIALCVAALFIALGTALDRIGVPRAEPFSVTAAVTIRKLLRQGWPVAVGMLGFLAFMVLTSRTLEWPISAMIILCAPVFAWLLNVSIAGGAHPASYAVVRHMVQDLASFRSMAGEVLFFMASGCAGTVIGGAIPLAWTASVGTAVAGSPAIACFTVSAAIVLLSGCALHPMLSAVIVGASLGPIPLGLPVLVHLSAVLVGWGLAIIVTPFSVVSAMASRWSGLPVLVVSLRANAGFVSLALTASSCLLGLLARWLDP